MADAESISLEETNRIRVSLGLAPLKPTSDTTPTTDAQGNIVVTADDQEREAVENLKRLRADQEKVANQVALKQRLQKAKDKAALNEKLSGKSLGAIEEGGDDDLKTWIKKTKKRERELAAKRAQELESQDNQYQDEYRAGMSLLFQADILEHLQGLTVGHDFDDIEQGEGVILTIKDRGILDDGESGDELINTTLAEKERLQENLDNKIRKPKYDPYAEEFDADTGQKKMLSKYDEEIQGKKGKTFVIGQEQETKATSKRNIPQISKNLTEISLEYDRPMEIVSDYVDPSTIKIKKPKKKKVNITRIKQTLDDEAESIADVQEAIPLALPTIKRTYDQDSGFGDDDELQEILAQQRRQNLKKRKISRPEDIVQSIRQHADEEEDVIVEGGLVIDDTSEFVRNLEMAHQEARQDRQIAVEEMMDVIEPEDVEMPNQDEISASEANERITNTGLEEEPLIAGSVAATLAALRRQGEISSINPTSHFTADELQRRQDILARQRLRKLQQESETRRQREHERQNERFNRMSQREREQYREQQNRSREKQEAQQRMQEFNEMKFNVELEYKDEFGLEMTPKDAFKHLSHTFHGKDSGTMKKGKYLGKVTKTSKTVDKSTMGDLEKVGSQRELLKKTGSAFTRIQ